MEHQVRFSKLHETRADIIADLYARLVKLQEDYKQFVFVGAQHPDEVTQREEIQKTRTAIYETSVFIEKNRIYLPLQTCESLKAFVNVYSLLLAEILHQWRRSRCGPGSLRPRKP